jgi:hypothetical protein
VEEGERSEDIFRVDRSVLEVAAIDVRNMFRRHFWCGFVNFVLLMQTREQLEEDDTNK